MLGGNLVRTETINLEVSVSGSPSLQIYLTLYVSIFGNLEMPHERKFLLVVA